MAATVSSKDASQIGPFDGEPKVEASQNEIDHHDPFLVSFHESEMPYKLPSIRKWIAVVVISSASLCVTCASSMAGFTEEGVAREFHVGREVAILSISLFIGGLGLGPLIVGPLSEVYGRNMIYRVSYVLFFALNFPVAFAPDIAVYLIFRFITGFCGSAFLSVAGGSVSDLFTDKNVSTPMALYTISPFVGPVVGPLLSGFINQNLDWRWTYYILIMWALGELLALVLFVPETFMPLLLERKAKRLRRETGDNRYWCPLENEQKHLAKAIAVSCYRPFELTLFDRMAFLLNLWSSMVLGILYLTFQAFPIIFMDVHSFNTQSTGMSFLGIGLGMLLGISTQPYWNRLYRRVGEENNGKVPPETRLIMGEIGGVLVPFGLFWLAFTTYKGVPWIVPIIASVPFGSGIYFVFTSTFTYLVTAYRPIAASAMASNSAMRSSFAAAFPLFANQMYHRLGTVGATALLAGLMTILAPLPFVFRRMGARLREESRFAHH
ncbi:major facilitator superfamily domain-containing protein [Gymnopilus junonius]|uniref:Major facilitator superfamily domain-containing protein n=1 Tax=Gymnopilus junonius TaxID=109634 RepID=A0A9P5TIC4_GYMJU|nr:major facilitator superfamily domain-containing protein [Gymnopilus junonius]